MKPKILLLLMLIAFISCSENKKDIKKTEKDSTVEVNALLDKWHKDAAETNLEDYFAIMAEDFTFLGTDGTENWNKNDFKEFCKPYFDQGRAWGFKCLERNVYFTNNNQIVWFDEVLDTDLGPCRGSGVIEYVDEKWLMHQYVLSMLVDNKDIKDVLEFKRENDSVLLAEMQ